MSPDNPREAGLTKKWVIELNFKLISKSNHKGFGRYLPAKYRAFEDVVAMIARGTCKSPKLDKAWVVIRPHFKNRIHVDLVNIQKSLLDGLVKGDVFSDDKDIACTVVPAVYGDENNEIEVWS